MLDVLSLAPPATNSVIQNKSCPITDVKSKESKNTRNEQGYLNNVVQGCYVYKDFTLIDTTVHTGKQT